MDGSCNGLQHYAALGRDKIGGTAVNLCPCDKPQDVYSGVMKEVIARVEEEAKKILDYDWNDENLTGGEKTALKNNQAAKLVNGLIDRGVVKRTVMTSVYGVTFIGAKQQIHEKIEEKVRLNLNLQSLVIICLTEVLLIVFICLSVSNTACGKGSGR